MAIFVPRFVRQLRDVLLTAPAEGEVLTYDSADAKWKNEAGGGGGGLTFAQILAALAAIGVTIDPDNGAVTIAVTEDAQPFIIQMRDNGGGDPGQTYTALRILYPGQDPLGFDDVATIEGDGIYLKALPGEGADKPVLSLRGTDANVQTHLRNGSLRTGAAGLGTIRWNSLVGDPEALAVFGEDPVVQQTAASVGDLWDALIAYGWLDAGSVAPTIGGAPTGATYITQTPDAGLSAEQALSALATGLVKNTTGTGVLSIAVPGTDYPSQAAFDDHSARHENGGADEISVAGLSGLLADAQTPLSHAHAGEDITSGTVADARIAATIARDSEVAGLAALVKLDDFATPDDNTDLNVSTTKHGLTPKLPNDATKYLDGTGAYTVPAGGGSGAPADAQYFVAAANGTLSAEVVVPAFIQTLLDDVDAATARATIGAGTSSVSSLDNLSDAAVSAAVAGETLEYDGSNFANVKRRSALMPAAAKAESYPRQLGAAQPGASLVTSRLALYAIDLPKGIVITTIEFYSGGTALSVGLNQLAGIYDDSAGTTSGTAYGLLRGSADRTNTAWGADAQKVFTLTSTYTTLRAGLFYVGLLVVATTVPTLATTATAFGRGALHSQAPFVVATANTPVTALPNPATSVISGGTGLAMPYFTLS